MTAGGEHDIVANKFAPQSSWEQMMVTPEPQAHPAAAPAPVPAPVTAPVPAAAPADDDAPDPAAVAALIAAQRERVREATDVDGRLLFGVWGVAWLVGFGAQWTAFLPDPLLPFDTAFVVFGALLVTAMVVTAVHLARQSTGIRGTSAQQGAMYGWTWSLAFFGIFALGFALARAEVGPATTNLVMTVASTLLVGALYMAGGAIWGDRTQFALGAWITGVTAVGAVVGHPHLLLVMAVAGGGGMLAAALAYQVQRSRRPVA
ncbi:hypothetical protein [Cellulomonas carbonis]|nr:hypothetical protein [Cellulomonas carbonis]